MVVGITLAPLLSLRIAHDYYGAAAVPIALEPTPETAAALTRGCCRLRVTQDLAQIYAQVPFGRTPMRDRAAPELISFRLTLQDTEVPLVTAQDWGEAARNSAVTFGPEEIGANGVLPAATGRALPVQARYSRVVLKDKVEGAQIALRAAGATSEDDPAWTAPLPPGPQGHLDLTAGELPEGAYRLELDGRTLREVIVSDLPPARVFGLVTVPMTGAEPVGPRETPKSLTLQFRASAPRWRYVLQSRMPGRDLSAARIKATAGMPDFGAPAKSNRNGRTVWLCESDGPIPLALRPPPTRRVSLTLPAESGPPPPPRDLPHAGPANTAMEPGPNGPEPWSTLYVTV